MSNARRPQTSKRARWATRQGLAASPRLASIMEAPVAPTRRGTPRHAVCGTLITRLA